MVASTENVIEVEVDSGDNDKNANLFFLPLQRSVRGRFDYIKVAEPKAKMKMELFHNRPIPGQRIGVNLDTGEGYIAEPLRDEENLLTREVIEKQLGQRVPQHERFTAIDQVTWLYWLRRAVDSGYARVVKGELPATIKGEPQKNFFSEPTPDPVDKLTAAIEAQTAMFAKFLDRLTGAGPVTHTK